MTTASHLHETVLLEEAVAALVTNSDGVYIDGTFGRGGHSRHILDQLSASGRLLSFDKDPAAVAVGQALAETNPGFSIFYGSFRDLEAQVRALDLAGKIDGILLDLGVSSPQLDDASRGFSFMHDGPLDMRMDNQQGVTAAEWLANADPADIAQVLKEYGEERFAKRIAGAVVKLREQQPITTTTALARLVEQAVPIREKGKHPATRTFQAIRIFINKELDDLAEVLTQSVNVLGKGGRLVVISFHSLEDRIVKRFIQRKEKGEPLPRHLPVKDHVINRELRTVQKPVRASEEEVKANVRSRSAIMRVAEKLQ